ncbi:Tet(A)/Tet(B)/Tet(C) family tetracycline efflux MFS transporter [Microtetraspora fusca]|uniref:Tet(A)/Tet(B)/Tet(C) family tetracycline efflux MFS transporter n=1 Tax=Microtetraspora fusca TaxID=1997 RepID=A0ABW6VFL1_MICFU
MMTTATLDALGLGLVMPVLPTLLSGLVAPRSVPLQVGVLTALYAVMQFLFAPVLGAISDRFGRRPVLLVSLAGATADYLVLALSPVLGVLYLGRAVAGITGATTAVAGSAIADVSGEDERARRFGMLGACYGIGMVAGPILGGLLGGLSPHAPFLAAAGLNGLNLLVGALLLRETRVPLPPAERERFRLAALNPVGSLGWVRMVPGLLALLAVFGLVQLIGQIPGSMWVLFTEHRFGWDPLTVGLSLAAFGTAHALTQALVTGPLVARLGERRALALGVCADAVGFLALSIAASGLLVLPILLPLALGGVAAPALQALLSTAVGDDRQGRLQGVLASLNSVSGIVGPLAFTALYSATIDVGDGWMWVCGAALYVLCVPALRRSRRLPVKAPARLTRETEPSID